MNRLEKVLYTAKAHTTGGRAGMSRSSDGRLDVKLRQWSNGFFQISVTRIESVTGCDWRIFIPSICC
jgi:hypothetical protein